MREQLQLRVGYFGDLYPATRRTRLSRLLVGVMLLALLLAPGVRGEEPQATSALPVRVFLPSVVKGWPVLPVLLAPPNGAVLDTLIPLFQWDMGSQPSNVSACLSFSTNPDHAGCNARGFGSSGPKSELAWYNLDPSTTYYWRVGTVYNRDYSTKYWSEQWSFTTGPAGGVILPAPSLVSPADNSTILASQALLTWGAVQDAVEYTITVWDIDENSRYGYYVTSSQLDLTMDAYLIRPGGDYEWYVEARNAYAWGLESARWRFAVAAAGAAQSAPGHLLDETGCVLDDGRWCRMR